MKYYDLVIVGGGLIGKSLACALQYSNLRIALIEKSPRIKASPSAFETRPLSLSWTSVQFLQSLRIWEQIVHDTTPITAVHISEKGSFGSTYLKANDYGLKAFGAVIDANVLEAALDRHLTLGKVDQYYGVTLSHFEKHADYWQFLINETSVSTSLLVGADGTESSVRQIEDIKTQKQTLNQFAFILSLSTKKPPLGIAYERFTDKGSLAILPCGKNKVKAVWVVSEQEILKLKDASNETLLHVLQKMMGYRVGQFTEIHSHFMHQIQVMASEKVYGHRLVLIGNAANTFHPIAAQGFNIGLRDVAELAQKITDCQKLDQDVGRAEVLEAYAKARQKEHASFRFVTRTLVYIFDLTNLPIRWGRSMGLMVCDLLPSLKKWIAYKGMGLQETLPNLSRGVLLDE